GGGGAVPRPTRPRPRHSVDGFPARPVARVGVCAFPGNRNRLPCARGARATFAAGITGLRFPSQRARRRCRACRPARLPFGRFAQSHRVEGGRARRRLVYQTVRGYRRQRHAGVPLGRIAFGIRHRSAALASRRVDPRRRARSACFRPHASRRRPAGGIGSGTSARSTLRARAVSSGASTVIFAPAPATPLSRWQLGWLAALVVLAQVPLWTHLRLWIVIAGSGLVALRIALPADRPPPARLRRWLLPLLALAVALSIRWDFGYFLAR